MGRTILSLALAAALPFATGCDTLKKASSKKLAVATVLQSPGITVSSQPIAPVVTARLFFGERDGSDNPNLPPKNQPAPRAITGAVVDILWPEGGQQTVSLPAGLVPGHYEIDSVRDARLHYVTGATYTFRVRFEGEEYTGTVEAPAPAVVEELQGTPVPKTITAPHATFPNPFVVTRDLPAGQEVPIGFYSVHPVAQGDTRLGAATCKNVPESTDAVGWLQLVFDPGPWKKESFDLATPTCFPSAGNYALVVTTARLGSTSSNLFLGSSVIAGGSDGGAIILQ